MTFLQSQYTSLLMGFHVSWLYNSFVNPTLRYLVGKVVIRVVSIFSAVYRSIQYTKSIHFPLLWLDSTYSTQTVTPLWIRCESFPTSRLSFLSTILARLALQNNRQRLHHSLSKLIYSDKQHVKKSSHLFMMGVRIGVHAFPTLFSFSSKELVLLPGMDRECARIRPAGLMIFNLAASRSSSEGLVDLLLILALSRSTIL